MRCHNTIQRLVLTCLFLVAINYSNVHAQSATLDDCSGSQKALHDNLRRVAAQLSLCKNVKQQELDNFYAKRARYRRLIVWAGSSKFVGQYRKTMDAIQERDVLLTPKSDKAAECLASVGDTAVAVDELGGRTSCQILVANNQAKLNTLDEQLRSCRACGLANLGHGYNKSPAEILVAQERDARVLREALYIELNNEANAPPANGRFSMFNPWQLTRDVFIAYVTDKTVKIPKSAKLNAMLQQLEKKLLASAAPDQSTDRIMAVYRQLEVTLSSASSHRKKQAKRLLEAFGQALPQFGASGDAARYTGFNDATDIARSFNSMSRRERNTLISAIHTAVERYQKLHSSS